MSRARCIFALALFLTSGNLWAGDAVVTVHVRAAQKLNGGQIVIRRIDDSKVAERAVAIAAIDKTRIEVEVPSTIAVSVRVPHFWSAEKVIHVSAPADIAIDVLPTGVLRGRTAADRLPSSIDVAFEPVNEKAGGALSGSVSCPLARDGSWTCELPEGVFDLRLHVTGFIPLFRTAVVIASSREVQLGAIALHRGASVAGRIKTGDSSPLTASCRVRLMPRSAATNTDKAEHDEALLKLVSVPDARGRFQFADVPPGSYDLVAGQKGYADVWRRRIPVLARTEALLNEPITLERPREADIIVSPSADPLGRPWTIRLFDADGGVTHIDALAAGATEDGHRRFGQLAPGRYFVTVSSGEETWFGEERTIVAADEVVRIDVPLRRVFGRVSLGERGLAAEITLIDKPNSVSIPLRSNAHGEFSAVLPYRQAWDVKVSAPDVHVLRTLRKVAVDTTQDIARMAIDLPDTTVRGTVVNPDGTPHGDGYVTAQDRQSYQQAPVAADGTFAFAGFDGDVSLQATATGGRASDQVTVHADAGVPAATAILKLRPMATIEGRLISATASVPGGRIFARATNAQAGSIFPESSDAAGEFRVRMLDSDTEAFVTVMAPGYALWHGRLRVGERTEILLNQLGGTLHVRLPAGPSPMPYCEIGGNAFLYALLANWSALNGNQFGDPSFKTYTEMPAGSYLICLPNPKVSPADLRNGRRSSARCEHGVLSPLGELTLDLSDKSP